MMVRARVIWLALSASVFLLSSCLVGPNYQRPAAPVTPTYKEKPPASYGESKDWQPAKPSDNAIRGNWWEVYNDPELNALEAQVAISNQNVLAFEAQYREAREAVRVMRSNLFPTLTAGTSISASRSGGGVISSGSGNIAQASSGRTAAVYNLPVSISWTADIWGSIRRTVRADIATAQATAAQLQNARLSYQATLADEYFQLHGLDSNDELLRRTVASYEEYLQLTRDRFEGGIASDADVAQAEAQLEATRASLADLEVNRAAYEHAVAILTGKPPSSLSLSKRVSERPPPAVPVSLPSTLLQRRPDVAQYERQVAAANEEIGVAKAAYYPTITLSASGGFSSTSITSWLTWPARFWSAGPSVSETLFDAGRRRAQVAEAQYAYDATVANYRQTVLTAFQQVEDQLAALRVLENEAGIEGRAVAAATRSLDVSTEQYKAGTVNYLNVLTAQTILLSSQQTAVNLLTRRMTASVNLIEALGGGWNSNALPAPEQIVRGQ